MVFRNNHKFLYQVLAAHWIHGFWNFQKLIHLVKLGYAGV